MTAQTKPFAFAGVAERLGKLIPRLASDHDGEVIATVSAIGRTLQGAGLDWHDLAKRVADPSYADVMAVAGKPASSPTPSWNPAPQPSPPKTEPSPWPTFGTTSHARRKLWLKAIAKEPSIMATVTAQAFKAFRDRMVDAPTTVTTDDTRLFNRLARAAWEQGVRIDRQPPPWPTWGTLSHFGKLARMDAILRDGGLSEAETEAFRAIYGPYYRAQEWSRKGVKVFNRHVQTMWERGWRPEEKAA